MIRTMTRKKRHTPSKEEVAVRWTSQYGLNNLYVSGAEQAEPNIIGKVVEACKGRVCEVGCGDGRVAAHFPPEHYTGVDISSLAVQNARKRCPGHSFKAIGYDDEYPEADTFVFYTVLLHVPDDVLLDVFSRARLAGATRIVIYEVMIGWIREYAQHDNFHRDPAAFVNASGMNETELCFVKSKYFPWCGNILILDI